MTPITITAVGNFVDIMTGTILGLLRSYLLICLFISWSWVKFFSPPDFPLVHPHVPCQPHHGPPRVAVDPPLDLDGEVLVHHVQGDSAALVLLACGGWLPKTLGNIPINGHFHVKTFFLKTAMVAVFAGMPFAEMTRTCSCYLSRIQHVIPVEGGFIE